MTFNGNAAPVVTPAANQSANEGASTSFTIGSFSDAGPSPWAVDIDWGDASTHTTLSLATAGTIPAQSHTYADGPATRTVSVKVTDNGGLSDTKTFTVTVANVAPTVAITGAPTTSPEGTAINLGSSVSDVAADVSAGFTYSWSVTKDGSPYATGSAASFSFTPNDNASYVVSLSATDKDGGVGTAPTKTITVTNVAPTATFTAPSPVAEGSDINLALTSPVDPSSVDTTAGFTYAFDCGSGYGSFGAGSTASCPTTDNGSRTVQGKIRDKDGGVSEYSASVTITNVAPTVAITGAPSSSPEGTLISLGSTVTDPSSVDQAAGFTYSWSVTKDGSPYATGSAASFSFTPDDNASYVVSLTATDKDGGAGTALAVTITVTNVAPTATLSVDSPIGEGSSSSVSLGSALDPSSADTTAGFHYSFACDGLTGSLAATYAAAGTSSSTTCPFDDNGDFTVRARIFDKDGGSTDYQADVHADNLPPTGTFTPTTPIDEGSSSDLHWTNPSDPSSVDAGSLHFKFACSSLLGDLDPISYATGSGTNSFPCPYADNGSYGVEGAIVDKDNGSIVSGGSVTVLNVAPELTPAAGQTASEGVAKTFSLGSFSDPGVNDNPWTVDVEWGDGDSTHFQVGAQGLIPATDHTYADNDTYTVTLIVTDKDGGTSAAKTFDVDVANVAPTVAITGAPTTSPEGSLITLDSSVTDVAADVAAGFTYSWSVTKDGSPYATGSAESFSFVPNDNASYVVSLTATDKDGGVGTAPTQSISVTNVAPTATVSNDGPVDEGSPVGIHLSGAGDPSSIDTAAGFHYSFDCTGGGSLLATTYAGAADTTGSSSCSFADNGAYTVFARIFDKDGGFTEYTTDVTVNNVAPTVDAGPGGTINEGSSFSSSGSFTDPGNDTWTATVDYGDGSGPQALALVGKTFSLSHVYADNGSYTVTVSVTDDDSGTGSDTATVTVNNVAPTLAISGAAGVDEGATYSLTLGAVTDPGADTVSSYVVHWGDGGSNTSSTNGVKTHVYADGPNSYSITVDLVDEDGTFLDRANALSVSVANVAPSIGSITFAYDPLSGIVTATAPFTDPGALDTHTASFAWSVSPVVAAASTPPTSSGTNASGSFSATLDLPPGCYTVMVSATVTDKDGASDVESATLAGGADAYQVEFRAPIKDDVRNLTKAGSTIPVKVVINRFCGGGGTVTSYDLYLAIASGAAANDITDPDLNVIADAGSSNDNGLKFRIADGGYIYNFSTKGLSNTSDYTLRVRLGSSTGPIIKTAVIRTQK